MAAPNAVVSNMEGLKTGIPKWSDWICINKLFWDIAEISEKKRHFLKNLCSTRFSMFKKNHLRPLKD